MKNLALLTTVLCLTALPASAFAGCGNLQSSASTQPADVKFVNESGGKVNVLWFKFKGGTKKYHTLAPTQSYVQATFRNHVWGFTDAKGKCLGTYVVKASGTFGIK